MRALETVGSSVCPTGSSGTPPRGGHRRRIARRGAAGVGVVAIGLAIATGIAGAQEAEATVETVAEATTGLGQQLNIMFIVLGAILVIFMQAGFALVETGFCRARHAAHVISTNFAVFGLGFVAFFAVGYSFMFGGFSYVLPGFDFGYTEAIGEKLIGFGDWTFLWGGGWALSGDKANTVAVAAYFLYMVAFMDTVATIPTGAMAERWRWQSFVQWALFCGAIYYPLFGAWTWGGGWLNQLGNNLELGFGYVDFAGSGVVHAVGGVAALAGAIVLGPRIGKFGADGKARAMPGHHIPMAMLGTFILLFGWFGFNAASTFAATDSRLATVAANTAIAGAFGAVAAMGWITRKTGKPDPGMMANGMLAGLVAITAPCAFVQPWHAAVIGTIAGVLVITAIGIVENRLKVDDPVGAISVHGVNGIFGVLCIGIFADGSYGAGWNLTTEGAAGSATGVTGILYDQGSLGFGQLGAQAMGALVICTVIFGVAFAFFKIQNALTKGGIRSDRDDELQGLDLPEIGVAAYPEFALHYGGPTTGSAPVPVADRDDVTTTV